MLKNQNNQLKDLLFESFRQFAMITFGIICRSRIIVLPASYFSEFRHPEISQVIDKQAYVTNLWQMIQRVFEHDLCIVSVQENSS